MTTEDQTLPRPAPAAAGLEVDGKPVLLDRSNGSLHVLNEVAAAIWSRLDESRTVSSLVAELSELFEAEPATVERDVQEFLSHLARVGLLEGSTAARDVEPVHTTPDGDSWAIDTLWVDWYTGQVIDALRANGIESIVLKGPAIRSWLYRDAPQQRGYLDADLLVPRGALAATSAVLSELGFGREDDRSSETLSPWAENWRRDSDGAVVDLHSTLHGCEHATVDPWPLLRATADQEPVGGTEALLPSIPARAIQVVLVSPADRPWRRWDDLGRALERLSPETWGEATALARALGVEREFGYRISQAAGPELAQRLGLPVAPRWWLRWDADPMLAWAALLAELPTWRARLRLARRLMRPPPGSSSVAWAGHMLRLAPGAFATLLRRPRSRDQDSRSEMRS